MFVRLPALRLLVVLYSLNLEFRSALAVLQCNACASQSDWSSCVNQSFLLECSPELVDATHKVLQQYNPSLGIIGSGSHIYDQFTCYSFGTEIGFPQNKLYSEGCTYRNINFCSGWNETFIQVLSCELNPPDDVVSSTTSTTSGSTSSNTDSPTSTTTTSTTSTPVDVTTTSYSTSSGPPPKSTSSGLSRGTIAGIAGIVAGFVGLLLLCALVRAGITRKGQRTQQLLLDWG
ncbi:uncharacterized protein LOC129757703 [Uranotaenia lowii]|uniref:uncharacterized protein LOC129757703 n=1 Tax=Uranotaenia lowii TaxID=190385 RepID=UPI002479D534|nr:uncharacterized protein LOC129757703 [Uranotaenia lowii]